MAVRMLLQALESLVGEGKPWTIMPLLTYDRSGEDIPRSPMYSVFRWHLALCCEERIVTARGRSRAMITVLPALFVRGQ